jgi:hypothetical protein
VAIKQLSEGVVVPLLNGGIPSKALVAMAAVGTKPDHLASGPVTVIVDAAGDTATEVGCYSFAVVTGRVPLGRSPRWR